MKKILIVLTGMIFLLSGCAEKSNISSIPEIDSVEIDSDEIDSVVIALLDTGISKVAIDEHSILEGYNYVEGTKDTKDKINHGTAVASVIVGSAPAKIEGIASEALVVPLVVLTKDEDGNLQSITPEVLAQAVYDSVDKYGADIINISLGIKKDMPKVKEAVTYANKQGVLVISAVGNDGEDEEYYYPAAYESVLAIGSHDDKGELSDFSQQNGTADLLAPGEDIWLASKNGKTYGARGTSFSTAYAAAAAARLLIKSPGLSPEEIRTILIHTSTGFIEGGNGTDCGVGILNLDAALDYN